MPLYRKARAVRPRIAGLAILLLVAACSPSTPRHPIGTPSRPSSTTSAATIVPNPNMPTVIYAFTTPTTSGTGVLPPGTVVPASVIAARVALGDDVVMGLASEGALLGTAYPAISRDGQRSWRIDGPRFYAEAAQGPSSVDSIGVTTSGVVFAWADGSNFVRITENEGAHWAEADFPSGVHSILAQGREIDVRAFGTATQGGQFTSFLYVSTNAGGSWELRGKQPDVSY